MTGRYVSLVRVTGAGSSRQDMPASVRRALAYYAFWYYVLGIGRARRDGIVNAAPYGAQRR